GGSILFKDGLDGARLDFVLRVHDEDAPITPDRRRRNAESRDAPPGANIAADERMTDKLAVRVIDRDLDRCPSRHRIERARERDHHTDDGRVLDLDLIANLDMRERALSHAAPKDKRGEIFKAEERLPRTDDASGTRGDAGDG